MENPVIRRIAPGDNPIIAHIIRQSLTEYGLNKPGTVYYDEDTDRCFELFQREGSAYFVAEMPEGVVGGAGIYPSNGLPEGVCELSRMYLKKEARGEGVGKLLLSHCIALAAAEGYQSIYLETMPELKKAISMYGSFGFEHLRGPIGDTGHFFCAVWMLKEL